MTRFVELPVGGMIEYFNPDKIYRIAHHASTISEEGVRTEIESVIIFRDELNYVIVSLPASEVAKRLTGEEESTNEELVKLEDIWNVIKNSQNINDALSALNPFRMKFNNEP